MKSIQRRPSKLLLSLLGSAAILVASGSAIAGIATTKHNLTTTGPGPNKVTAGTDEICVFCHTPHAASSTAGGPPLWNKTLPAGTGYTLYSSSTIDGNTNTTNAPSLACLSCHDGVQAMDNIINAPGSNGLDATGGGTTGRGFTWATGGTVDSNGTLTSGVALLGTDLSNDHPVMIEYCGGGKTGAGTAVSGTCRDLDFVGQAAGTTARLATRSVTVGTTPVQVFWVDTGTPNAVSERSDIRLYTRNGGNTPFVECASCHDPHVAQGDAGPNGTTAGATFLRVSNTASAVCLACHVK